MQIRDSAFIIWHEMLTGIFPVIGRMACLASCYNPQTRYYFHNKVAEQLGCEETDRSLRITHELVWADWMQGSFGQQQADLQLYLSSSSQGMSQAIICWRMLRPFLTFIPASAKLVERVRFVSNLETILELLDNQHGVEPGSFTSANKLANSDVLQQLIRMIRERYKNSGLSLKTLSCDIHLSERHLGRVFKCFIGKPFRQYLCELRVTEAAALLITTKESIKVIASTVGYNHCSHFDKDFRVVMSCTPIEFRARNNSEEHYDPAAWI